MAEPRIVLGATRERPGFDAAQNLVTYVDVPYSVPETGSSGMVSVLKSQFTAELVHQLVRSEVAELVKLHNAFSQG